MITLLIILGLMITLLIILGLMITLLIILCLMITLLIILCLMIAFRLMIALRLTITWGSTISLRDLIRLVVLVTPLEYCLFQYCMSGFLQKIIFTRFVPILSFYYLGLFLFFKFLLSWLVPILSFYYLDFQVCAQTCVQFLLILCSGFNVYSSCQYYHSYSISYSINIIPIPFPSSLTRGSLILTHSFFLVS
jgi:hypothetical protein